MVQHHPDGPQGAALRPDQNPQARADMTAETVRQFANPLYVGWCPPNSVKVAKGRNCLSPTHENL